MFEFVAMTADLTEEVARIVGYDKVGVMLLDTALPPQRHNEVLEAEEQLCDILVVWVVSNRVCK